MFSPKTALVAALLALAAAPAQQARIELPRLSPHATVTQVVGTTEISIDYSRPAVRGRKIWGELVPFETIWRTGANDATVITFDSPVAVVGEEVPAGSYALFTIPHSDEHWTVVLNAQAKQWGAYNHDPAQDVTRFEVRPNRIPKREYMSFSIEPTAAGAAEIRLEWDELRVAFPIEIDVQAVVATRIEAALDKAGPNDWQVYMQAANYYFDNDLDALQALDWINQSVLIEQRTGNLVLLARLLDRVGETRDAIDPMTKAVELSRANAPAEYTEQLQKELEEWRSKVR